jgi:hypothetical protein
LARLESWARALPQTGWEPRFLATALLALLVAAALALPEVAQDEPPAGEASMIGGVSAEEALRLRALGYVDYSPEVANLDKAGVSHLDASLAAPGHVLVVSSLECAARLIRSHAIFHRFGISIRPLGQEAGNPMSCWLGTCGCGVDSRPHMCENSPPWFAPPPRV